MPTMHVLDLVIITVFFVVVLQLPSFFFFFNDTATTEIYTLSLHDALPIYLRTQFEPFSINAVNQCSGNSRSFFEPRDRKSTRLNSSHMSISYAVFCLKKKKLPKQGTSLSPLPHNQVN